MESILSISLLSACCVITCLSILLKRYIKNNKYLVEKMNNDLLVDLELSTNDQLIDELENRPKNQYITIFSTFNDDGSVEILMRYGNMSMRQAKKSLYVSKQIIDELISKSDKSSSEE